MEELHRFEQVSCADLQQALDLALREMGSYAAFFDQHGEIAAVAAVLVTASWCADHGVPKQHLVAAIDESYPEPRRRKLANP
jgi:hypothetical protein